METTLQRLTDLDEIEGAILVGKDGLIVAGTLHSEDEEVIGAMSAATFGSTTSFTAQINHGETRSMTIETRNGMVFLEEAGDLILVVTARNATNIGRIRVEMRKVCRQVVQLVAASY